MLGSESKYQMIDYTEQIGEALLDYREDPIGFAVDLLGFPEKYVWFKMVEMAEAIRDHQLVCIRAGHNVSKTFTLGRIIVPWFKCCFQPSTVVTTAPGENQVKNQMWREVRASKTGAVIPLGGKIHSVHWDMKPKQSTLDDLPPMDRANWEKNFAIGFATSPDSCAEHCTKMAGWHNEWVLVVVDEGCGMLDQILTTAEEGLINDAQCKMVISGNPTDPESLMAKYCYSSDSDKQNGTAPYVSDEGWYVITISATDTPNYKQRKRVIPGLASYNWVQRIVKKYGADGDGTRYRVKGLFPLFKEGTYYGRLLAAARKGGRVTEVPHNPTARVYTFSDTGDRWTFTLFVQFIRETIRVVDEYWDNEGMGLPAWAKFLQNKPYVYGDHFAGPEIDPDKGSGSRSFHTGKTLIQTAAQLGFELTPVVRHQFNDGIESGRAIWPLVTIDSTRCPILLKGMAGYGKKKNNAMSTESEIVYHDQPAKTWHRHIADSWRHLAIAWQWMSIGEEYYGDNVHVSRHHRKKFLKRLGTGMRETVGMRMYS